MDLDRLKRSLQARPGAPLDLEPPYRRAAIAAIFRPGPDLLFIRREDREGDPWSGHMAWPGGRVEGDDESVRAAAERETWEETGLDLSGARLLGQLDEQMTPKHLKGKVMIVTPFVFALDHDPVLRTNYEVAGVHWFSLQRLLDGEGRGTMDYEFRGTRWTLPCVRLDGTLVWGLTLRALDGMLERLR